MDRMRTFLLYALGIIGFMVLSYILEDGLIENMYAKIDGSVAPSSSDIAIEDVSVKSSNVNGKMEFKVKNNSDNASNEYVKLELFNSNGGLAGTRYLSLEDLKPGESKNYQINFKGNKLKDYKLSIVDEVPANQNIISILGMEVDLSNVFGNDLSDFSIMGVRIADVFSVDNAKTLGGNIWSWGIGITKSIPLWGYLSAASIILWRLPAGFLFFL